MNVSELNRRGTTIGHLQLRYRGVQEEVNQTNLRLRVERLLNRVDLEPPGLTSGAVLIVRKLDGLAPLELSAAGPARTAWSEELCKQMSALYAAATRPVLGPVSPSACSVLFVDTAEMLTCLTRDLLSDQAWSRWYWHQVLRNVPRVTHTALTSLWCENASFVPGVLAALRPAEARAAVMRLEPHEVKQVIYALYESFELPTTIVSALSADAVPLRGMQDHLAVSPGEFSAEEPPGAASSIGNNIPPWERWLAVKDSLLPVEGHYLLGVSAALYHTPSFARSAGFAARASAWLQAARREPETVRNELHGAEGSDPDVAAEEAQESSTTKAAQPLSQMASTREENDAGIPLASARSGQVLPVLPEQIPEPVEDTGVRTPSQARPIPTDGFEEQTYEPGTTYTSGSAVGRAEPSPGRDRGIRKLGDGTPGSAIERAEPLQMVQRAPGLQEASSPNARKQDAGESPVLEVLSMPVSREFVLGVSKALPTNGVATALGGVLYLVNLLLWLKLPLSWSEDGAFAEYMGGWAIVEALARGLLGDLHEQLSADPLWVALALLDRREPGTSIASGGISLGDERVFRLPAEWLRGFGSSEWLVLVREERLLLVDEVGGYLVADVPLRGGSFMEIAHVEVETYIAQGLTVTWRLGGHVLLPALYTSIAACMSDDACWWLGRVLGFVQKVLARALGVALDDPGRLATLLLCKYGKLLVSRTHVDLHMSMEEISLPIRRAGLDRDPGWVPDLARIVYFHFD